METVKFNLIDNFSPTKKGQLLTTKGMVDLNKGDQYIGLGFMGGENIFTWDSDEPRRAVKVVARTSDCVWGWTGNNKIAELPVLNELTTSNTKEA